MNNIERTIGLYGEYRITVKEADTVIKDSGWSKNTILSSGLELLFSNNIPQCIQYLDLGTNSTNAGNYALTGVLSPSNNTELVGISSNNVQYYPNSNIQSYYATYSSPIVSTQAETITEFCVKNADNTIGFARNVLTSPIAVNIGQNVNFEYRLSLTYNTQIETGNLSFKTPTDTFYTPFSAQLYNLPNMEETLPEEVGRIVDAYPLILVQNNDDLPIFGDTYPIEYNYAVNKSSSQSTFSPTIVFSGFEPSTKTFTAVTEYKNLSTPYNSGVFDNINSAILVYNDVGFHITRFTYPLALYNYTTVYDKEVSYSSAFTCTTSISTISNYNELNQNLLSLFYKYTWSEQSDSIFTTPSAFSLSALQLIPCNINLTINLSSGEEERITSDYFTTPEAEGNDTRIRVNLSDTNHLYNLQIGCSAQSVDVATYPYGPSPIRAVVLNSLGEYIYDTGYMFTNFRDSTWQYTQEPIDAVSYYNTLLQTSNNSVITQSLPFNFNLNSVYIGEQTDFIDVIINTPFEGVSWATSVADIQTTTPSTSSTCSLSVSANFETEFEIDYGSDIGWCGINFNIETQPAKFDILWDEKLYTSNYLCNSSYTDTLVALGIPLSDITVTDQTSGSVYFYKEFASPTSALITVNAPISATIWTATGICPSVNLPSSYYNNVYPFYIESVIPTITPSITGIWSYASYYNGKPLYINPDINGQIAWSLNDRWEISVKNAPVLVSYQNVSAFDVITEWIDAYCNDITINWRYALNTVNTISLSTSTGSIITTSQRLLSTLEPISINTETDYSNIQSLSTLATLYGITNLTISNDILSASSLIATTNSISQILTSYDGTIVNLPIIETLTPISVVLGYDGTAFSLPSISTVDSISGATLSDDLSSTSSKLLTVYATISSLTFSNNLN